MVAPMSVMKRVSMLFRAKANKALDRMEDPSETLDYSYQTQLELLQKVRRGVADVATSRKRIELQMNQLQQSSDKLDRQARDALAVGREDLARDALTRKAGLQGQLSDLNTQYTTLQGEEERLRVPPAAAGQGRRLPHQEGNDQGHVHRRRGADQDQRGVHRHFGGNGRRRAGDPARRRQDRADACAPGALDELIASGAIDDVVSGPRDDIQAELDRMGAGHDVEAELARIKGELGQAARHERSREPRTAPPAGDGQAAQPAQPAPPVRRLSPPISRRQVTGRDRPDPRRGPAEG